MCVYESECVGTKLMVLVLLVVEYDVWSPNVITGHVKLPHTTVFIWIPLQLVVVPKLKYYNQLNAFIGIIITPFCKNPVPFENI